MKASPKDIRQKYKHMCSQLKKMDTHYKKIITNLHTVSLNKTISIDETTTLMSHELKQQQREIVQLRNQLDKLNSGTSPLQDFIECRAQDLQNLLDKKTELGEMQQKLKENTDIFQKKHRDLVECFTTDSNFENIGLQQQYFSELEDIKSKVDEYMELKNSLSQSVLDLNSQNYDSTDINSQIVGDFENQFVLAFRRHLDLLELAVLDVR